MGNARKAAAVELRRIFSPLMILELVQNRFRAGRKFRQEIVILAAAYAQNRKGAGMGSRA